MKISDFSCYNNTPNRRDNPLKFLNSFGGKIGNVRSLLRQLWLFICKDVRLQKFLIIWKNSSFFIIYSFYNQELWIIFNALVVIPLLFTIVGQFQHKYYFSHFFWFGFAGLMFQMIGNFNKLYFKKDRLKKLSVLPQNAKIKKKIFVATKSVNF